MKAKFIATQGYNLEAIIEINGQTLCVMDEFTSYADTRPKVGECFDFEFSNFCNEDESWEMIFNSNPQKKIGIEQLSGWMYQAFGKIVGVHPVRIDCGLFVQEDVVYSRDSKLIGEYVAFTITRLSGYATDLSQRRKAK